MTPLIELRVLSGPSLGAAIELAAGVHVIGAGDDCDLVFAADASVAARHLELRIHEREGGFPEVLARPLEGAIVVNGVEAPETGVALGNGEALGLGFTALAWQPVGASWGSITLAPLEFAHLMPAGKVDMPEDEAASTPATGADETTAEAPAAKDVLPRSKRLSRTGAGLAAALALAFVLIAAGLALGKDIPGFSPSTDTAARHLRAALDAAGFREIRVKTDAARALALRGEVKNDQELRRVFDLAAGLPFRVHVEKVRVSGDLLRFTRETLNAHGFFPDVRYRDDIAANQDAAARHDLALALYLKDGMVEAGMMASLSPDLPKLATASRKVIYARDLAPVLEAELSRIGLEGERAIYLAGKVILPYRLDIEARRKLDAALETVRKNLGVPVVFQVTETMPDRLSGKRRAPDSGLNSTPGSGARPTADGLGGLKVMSVTLGAIPFVTMSDQQKFFPGAVLPGGATLVSIHADRLILQAGEETITYPLKEAS